MAEKAVLICPDCNSEYITPRRMTQKGKCELCERREKHLLKVGKSYIKIINLPETEKKAVLSRRKTMKSTSNKNKPQSTVKKPNNTKGQERKYSNELLQYSYNALNDGVEYETLFQMIKDEFGLEVTKKGLNSALWRFKNNKYKNKEEYKTNKNKLKTANPIIRTVIINKDEQTPSKEEVTKDSTQNTQTEEIKQEEVKKDITNEFDINISKEQNIADTYNNILNEVNNIANTKFTAMDCRQEEKYTTDTYIKVLNILLDLCEHRGQILSNRQKQHDIMNAYQNDVLHEVENLDIYDTDNSLLLKLKTVRDKRRYYEYDYNDVGILKPFLETIDLNKLKMVLGQLNKFKEVRENIVYKPNVDITMTEKYDWVIKTKSTNESDIKQTKITSTITEIGNVNQPNNKIKPKFKQQLRPGQSFAQEVITTQENIKNNKVSKRAPNVKKFKVTCELSGSGYGAFSKWERQYTCLNDELAKSFAEQELNQIKAKNKGVLVTNLSVTQIPI